MVQLLWKILWQVLRRLNVKLPNGPAIPGLGTYSRETETHVGAKSCTQMCIVAFTVRAEKQRQPKCPSANEWINHAVYLYTELFEKKRITSS